MEQARVRLAALAFGHVGEMLAGSLAVGWASMSRRASDTWKHQSSASWASLSACWRWAPVFLTVWESRMAFSKWSLTWRDEKTLLELSPVAAVVWLRSIRRFPFISPPLRLVLKGVQKIRTSMNREKKSDYISHH